MKIVKEINDNEWAKKRSFVMSSPLNIPCWSWGFGNDGLLYCKGLITGYSFTEWIPYHKTGISITLSEMKKIVKEFGHLIVFT